MAHVVITGCSSGIGLELCRQLTARGDVVYAACRNSSPELEAVGVKGGVVTGVDVCTDAGCDSLRAYLAERSVRVDVLVNNAGGLGAAPGHTWDEQVAQQTFGANLDVAAMSRAFEVNVVGVVRVSKALESSVKAPGGKIAIISSLMGSCGDNGSGGFLPYRVSKAAVNMAGVTMACDLKEKGIAVGLIHPGMLQTNFGNLQEAPKSKQKHFRPVEPGCVGVVQAIDALTMQTTGSFIHGNYGNGLKPCPW